MTAPFRTLATRKVTFPDAGVVALRPQTRTVAPRTGLPASVTRIVTFAPPALDLAADRASGGNTSVAQ